MLEETTTTEPVASVQTETSYVEEFNVPTKMIGIPKSDTWMMDVGFGFSILEQLSMSDPIQLENMRLQAVERATAETTKSQYTIKDGVAYLSMQGMMTKDPTCMAELFGGGTSTVMFRRSLRTAMRDEKVKSVMMLIDSGGGEVNGVFDLADDIYNLQQSTGKPIDAYIEDEGMSAAYLVASQARKIYANSSAAVGSIGVFTVLADSSKALREKGIKMFVVKTGKYKAIGTSGVEITKEQLAHVQGRVDAFQGLFLRTIERQRNMGVDALAEVADAGIFVGAEAVKYGLVDEILTIDAAHQAAVTNKNEAC